MTYLFKKNTNSLLVAQIKLDFIVMLIKIFNRNLFQFNPQQKLRGSPKKLCLKQKKKKQCNKKFKHNPCQIQDI